MKVVELESRRSVPKNLQRWNPEIESKPPDIGDVFEAFAVYDRIIHPFEEIVYILEFAVLVPLRDDALHSRLADAFHRSQAEPHVALLVRGEVVERFVDIGPEHPDTHALALVHVERNLLDVRKVAAEQRRP